MNRFWTLLRQTGPALILAAVVLGPGSLTLSTIAGSRYGYRLLWVVVLATLFMIAYTMMSARIALVTKTTLLEAARRRYGRWPAAIGGIFGFLSIVAFQAGNSAAVGFSGHALFGSDPRLWVLLMSLPAVALILSPNLYTKLELLVRAVILLMITGFVGTLVIVGTDTTEAIKGLVPSFPDQAAVFLALGMSATTFSIAAAAYQSYLMREKSWGPDELSTEGVDCLLGIAVLGSISAVVLLTSAGVLGHLQTEILSAQTMALQLEPVFGSAAFYLFICGFFFAGFSSLVVNPLIGAALLVDGFGRDCSMSGKPVRKWATLILAIGCIIAALFGQTPLELLRVAQALAIVAFPVLGFLIWALARDRSVMGSHRNSIWLDVFAGAGYLTIIGICLNYVRQLIG